MFAQDVNLTRVQPCGQVIVQVKANLKKDLQFHSYESTYVSYNFMITIAIICVEVSARHASTSTYLRGIDMI